MEIEYISLPKLKREIRRVISREIKYFCAACLDQQQQMYTMQASDGNDDGLDPVRRKLPS